MKIIATVHNPLPPSIHIRNYDWIAFYDDGPDTALAFGSSEREAIDELTRRFPCMMDDEL